MLGYSDRKEELLRLPGRDDSSPRSLGRSSVHAGSEPLVGRSQPFVLDRPIPTFLERYPSGKKPKRERCPNDEDAADLHRIPSGIKRFSLARSARISLEPSPCEQSHASPGDPKRARPLFEKDLEASSRCRVQAPVERSRFDAPLRLR